MNPANASTAAPRRGFGWRRPLWLAATGVALALALAADHGHARWAARLAQEGTPPPATAPASPTGYVLGQRHFLGTTQRGETYRWIAAVQAHREQGVASSRHYDSDTVPTGRPDLLPRIQVAWLGVIAWFIHRLADLPFGLAVEQAARWEPLISHGLALLAGAVFMGRRFGAASAAVTAAFFALYPPLFSQFVPGALTADAWALLAACYAIAAALVPFPGRPPGTLAPLPAGSAVAAAGALWLNPAFGMPAVLIAASMGAVRRPDEAPPSSFVRWAATGAGLVTLAWAADQAPWDPAVSELRAVHPLYALAWLGLGVVLVGWMNYRQAPERRGRAALTVAAGVLLAAPLVVTQLRRDFPGWLNPGADLRRFAPLDHSPIFNHSLEWLIQAQASEVILVLAPLLAALLALALSWSGRPPAARHDRARILASTVALTAVVLLAAVRLRWTAAAALVALPVLWPYVHLLPLPWRRATGAVTAAFLFILLAWGRDLPNRFRQPAPDGPAATDVEALIFRQFAHWLATRSAGEPVAVLAPPTLSDSIVFHGGGRVLLSTAWESHPGHVAASRILSSPESTEAEAVIQSLGLTHLVLTSWDPVLPLLVKDPLDERDTLHARLQRWVLPPYLRPIPYRLPATPAYATEKLAVFQVVPPQDEALLLARLAEYFAEVDRPEPAARVAEALQRAYPDDPNAVMGRALVAEAAGRSAAFHAELTRLAAHVQDGLVPMDWDRRALRAIVLALGKRHELARAEIAACCETMSEAGLRQLTPRQAFQLRKLVELYRLEFPSPELRALAHALSSEYPS